MGVTATERRHPSTPRLTFVLSGFADQTGGQALRMTAPQYEVRVILRSPETSGRRRAEDRREPIPLSASQGFGEVPSTQVITRTLISIRSLD